MLRCQFKTLVEHNCWKCPEKSMYFITALQGRATDALHRIPKGATYEETLQALEDRFGDQHFAAAYRSQLKTRTHRAGESCKILQQPSNSLPTAPIPHYPKNT
jgi:hypothetical protein